MSVGRGGGRRRRGRGGQGRGDGRGRIADPRAATTAGRQSLTGATYAEPGHAGEHELPHESLAPLALAVGIGLLAFGLLTSLVFSVVGIATMGWALAAWIEEMRHG